MHEPDEVITETAAGPAAGSSGAGVNGGATFIGIPKGRYCTQISLSLRSDYFGPIQSGSILVEVINKRGNVTAISNTVGNPNADSALEKSGFRAGYVSTGRDLTFRPNWFSPKNVGRTLLIRVWHRDDLGSGPFIVDVEVTHSERPGPTGDEGHMLWDMTRGKGTIRRVAGTNPGANAEASIPVPQGLFVRPMAFEVVFVPAAATRISKLAFEDAAGAIMAEGIPQDETAAASTTLVWHETLPFNGNNAATQGQTMPRDIRIHPGGEIRTNTVNLAGADDYAAPVVCWEEFVVPTSAAS